MIHGRNVTSTHGAEPLHRFTCKHSLSPKKARLSAAFAGFGFLQDTAKLLHLNKGQVVTAYSAFQRLTQRAGPPGQPVGDAPLLLPPIPADAQQALARVGLKEAGVPSLADIGYHDQPTSPFKVCMSLQMCVALTLEQSERTLIDVMLSPLCCGDRSPWLTQAFPLYPAHIVPSQNV